MWPEAREDKRPVPHALLVLFVKYVLHNWIHRGNIMLTEYPIKTYSMETTIQLYSAEVIV